MFLAIHDVRLLSLTAIKGWKSQHWFIWRVLSPSGPFQAHQKRKIGSEKSTPRCLFSRKGASHTPHIENPIDVGRFGFAYLHILHILHILYILHILHILHG